MNISVTWLSSYLYCKRKFFLEQVLGMAEPLNEIIVKGKIKHEVYDLANKQERGIVLSIDSADREFIFGKYKNAYLKNLNNILLIQKSTLESLKLSQKELFEELWPFFQNEANARTDNIVNFVKKTQLFGKELWEALQPKIESEMYIESDNLGLKGKIDRVEKYQNPDNFIPVELKTGSAPKEGVWEGHLIQVSAYMMLLEDRFNAKIDTGKVVYLSQGATRDVKINPFIKDEIKRLVREINALLAKSEHKEAPAIAANRNKCDSCGLRKGCFNL